MRHIPHVRPGLIPCVLPAVKRQCRTAATFGYFDQCSYQFFVGVQHSFRFKSRVAEKAAEQYWRQAAAQSGLGEDRSSQLEQLCSKDDIKCMRTRETCYVITRYP